MTAWVCPKCGRVWAWWVSECNVCNAPVITSATTDAHPATDRTAALWAVVAAAQRVSYLGGQNDIYELRAALNALHDDEPPDAPRDISAEIARDKALADAVRNMPPHSKLIHFDQGAQCWCVEDKNGYKCGNTPAEALGLDGDA